MTLREFIEQEIMEDHVFDIEEFGTKVPRGCDKWDAYHREIEHREINHNEFLAIFKKSVPEENGR